MSGTHCTFLIIKDNNSLFFDSSGGPPDKFLLNQFSESIIFHNYKNLDTNSRLSGVYCFYFLYVIERIDYYNAVLKTVLVD